MKSTTRLFLAALSLAALSAGAWAQTAASTTPPPKKKHKAEAPAPAVTAADVQALKDALAAQQQQIQALQDELHHKDQTAQQAQASAADAAAKADAAQAQAAQDQQAVGQLKTDVSDLKTNATNTALTLQETQKNISASLENPVSLHYKGITLTPGGFLVAETVWRNRALGGEATPFNSLTMPGASQSNVSEFYGSGRQSRLSMLATGQLANVKLNGYYEADFLGVGTTSNPNQTNSYPLRQRQAYAQAAFTNGWTITGGQMWTLLTETKHGVDNRSEATPMTIDPNYTVGFTFARQYGLRLSKSFNNKAWLAVSIEDPQATITTHGNADNFLLGSAGAGGGLFNAGASASATGTAANLANYSFNPSPDIVAKFAFEPGFGHYEIFGIFSRFRDRVFPCEENFASAACGSLTAASAVQAFNSSTNGGGIGANARWSFAQKHVDFGLHAFTGRGEGRYAASGLPDASIHGDGSIDLIRTAQALGTLEYHARKFDVYFNAGVDYAGRSWDFDPISGKYVGYGSPKFSNAGCFTEVAPTTATGFFPSGLATCTADTRAVVEGTFGFWFTPYDGSTEKVNRGRIQLGPQFSYLNRNVWSGVGGDPHGLDFMIYTSFRYYLP
jgi:hypothetical protein